MTGKLLAGFIAACMTAGSSVSAPVTWIFEGHVAEISADDPMLVELSSRGVEPGNVFSGMLDFETTTTDTIIDSDGDPLQAGNHPGAITTFSFTAGSFQATPPPEAPDNAIDVVPGLGRFWAYGRGIRACSWTRGCFYF